MNNVTVVKRTKRTKRKSIVETVAMHEVDDDFLDGFA
tara:strand:+ start:1620 stop:1730 length:111 start_codon:yes stop_codon:yes gene_type:complete